MISIVFYTRHVHTSRDLTTYRYDEDYTFYYDNTLQSIINDYIDIIEESAEQNYN